MIWESQSNRTASEIITNQLQALQDDGLISNITVFRSKISQSPHDFAFRVSEDLWHSFKITDVTLVIPYCSTAETYTSASTGVQNSSTESFELSTWYPFLASGRCGNVSRVDVIDKWLVENSKEFLKITNLFRNKISRNSMGCTLKYATCVRPPIIVEPAQGNKQKCSGTTSNILKCILEILNLSIECKFLVSTNNHSLNVKLT
jgi:hypothetical protein